MYDYRQHPIVLFGALFECLLLGVLGAALALRFGQALFLALVLFALLSAIRRGFAWSVFSVRIKGQQVAMRSLHGLSVHEQIVLFGPRDGVRTKQSMPGYLLDYGDLQIETFDDEPVRFLYIARFSALRRQIGRS
jgi:hypothetical protein